MFHEVRKRIEGTQDSHAMSDQEMEQWYRFIQNAVEEAKMSGRNNPRGYPRFAKRVANRFLEANRGMPTSFRLAIDRREEVVARNLKELREKLHEVLREMHSYGLGYHGIEVDKRLRIERDGTINLEYLFIDGNDNTSRYAVGLELWAENDSMGTSEIAKPIDIRDFKKMLEGDKF